MQRHHYIPQFYLRKWYVPGKKEFWLYCHNSGRITARLRAARSVAYCKGLYSTIPEFLGIKPTVSDEIELKFFSPLDSVASNVHQKILSSGVASLIPEERWIWSVFVNSLLERSPTRISQVKEVARKIVDNTILNLRSRITESRSEASYPWEMLNLEAVVNNTVLGEMMKWISDGETVHHLYGMCWTVTRLREGKNHFITGDTPVVINGGGNKKPIHLVSLALSPNTLLLMHSRDSDTFDDEFIKNAAILHTPLIAQQTKRYLVSSRELLDEGNVKYRRILHEIFGGRIIRDRP